ncbi:uncharacterized protein MYCGRDRAFT_92289 [Zymoseptoria tritici IPO323]|uniref:Uncharacterized protein n=1 Tax=Zymoseptoria tritici (strain CBS 115943 / IPO323) TaxID=336722 RepID=F9X869_ZYMTI|nr:uncharacterized protein MYCGRDRAFT_92289 [Zymoseptoria tritici IPO323]EGP87808.1 hypothetical protein MYCGRDRAFT_92289 [Zymoseptoria tritici IPO323]
MPPPVHRPIEPTSDQPTSPHAVVNALPLRVSAARRKMCERDTPVPHVVLRGVAREGGSRAPFPPPIAAVAHIRTSMIPSMMMMQVTAIPHTPQFPGPFRPDASRLAEILRILEIRTAWPCIAPMGRHPKRGDSKAVGATGSGRTDLGQWPEQDSVSAPIPLGRRLAAGCESISTAIEASVGGRRRWAFAFSSPDPEFATEHYCVRGHVMDNADDQSHF